MQATPRSLVACEGGFFAARIPILISRHSSNVYWGTCNEVSSLCFQERLWAVESEQPPQAPRRLQSLSAQWPHGRSPHRRPPRSVARRLLATNIFGSNDNKAFDVDKALAVDTEGLSIVAEWLEDQHNWGHMGGLIHQLSNIYCRCLIMLYYVVHIICIELLLSTKFGG